MPKSPEQYQPLPEEIKKEEEMMTYTEKRLNEEREKLLTAPLEIQKYIQTHEDEFEKILKEGGMIDYDVYLDLQGKFGVNANLNPDKGQYDKRGYAVQKIKSLDTDDTEFFNRGLHENIGLWIKTLPSLNEKTQVYLINECNPNRYLDCAGIEMEINKEKNKEREEELRRKYLTGFLQRDPNDDFQPLILISERDERDRKKFYVKHLEYDIEERRQKLSKKTESKQ